MTGKQTEAVQPTPVSSGPLTIRIGVTGHRTLKNPGRIRSAVDKVLAEIDQRLGSTTHGYSIVSPLAEGADQLVATCVLEWKGAEGAPALLPPRLEVLLPMSKEEYLETFDTERREESIRTYEALLSQANAQTVLPASTTHKHAYERAGRYVVANCEVLIAIWDGRPARGQGGTADVVDLAKASNRTVFWINSNSGVIRRLPNAQDFLSQVDFLNEYNRESPGAIPVQEEVRKHLERLRIHAAEAGLDPAVLDPLRAVILPCFGKATLIAARYQQRYFGFITAAYIISACAVGTAAMLSLFFAEHETWFLLEFLEIALVVVLVWPPASRTRLRRWIDYRYLAERLRAACFLYVAGLNEETSGAPPDMRLSWLAESWVTNLVRNVWKTLPPIPESLTLAEANVRKFLFAAWIEDQRRYYHETGDRNREWHEWLERSLRVLLILTLVTPLVHVLLPKLWPEVQDTSTPLWLSVLAVTLPAFASALAGISVFRQYNRNAERYENMSRHLRGIGERMFREEGEGETSPHQTKQLTELQRLVQEADRAMAHEHQGWRAVFGVHLPGPG